MRVLVTGADGLIGKALLPLIAARGWEARGIDIRRDRRQDLTLGGVLEAALDGVDGVVHLAAVSRVVWAEREPELCRATNVAVLERMLPLLGASPRRPWLVFASSREVYGDAPGRRVREDAPLRPLNVYARSKRDGERLVAAAAADGLRASICRFSGVYGDPDDYPDRVAMAFAGAAATGGTMRVEGASHTFDFTHIDDAAGGLMALVEATAGEGAMPPVHFVSGEGTTLMDLARLAASLSLRATTIEHAGPRSFDVSHFVGDPERAKRLLGWSAKVPLRDGMASLVREIAAGRPAAGPR